MQSVQYFSLLEQESESRLVILKIYCSGSAFSEKPAIITLKGYVGLLNNYFRLLLENITDNLFLSMV